MAKETLRDRLSTWSASIFPANYHVDPGLTVNEMAFNGLLASSGVKFHERGKVIVTAHADSVMGSPLEVTSRVKQYIHLPWQEKIKRDELIIDANPSLLGSYSDSANDDLARKVAFFGHHIKHRRIRTHLSGFLLLSAVSGAARLAFLALDPHFPQILDWHTPSLPIFGEQPVENLFLLAAVGFTTAGLVQFAIRRPLHERQFERKTDRITAYARRIGPIISA